MNYSTQYGATRYDELELGSVHSSGEAEIGGGSYGESSESEYDSAGEESTQDINLPWCWQVLMGQAADQLEEKRQEMIEAQVVNGVSEAQAVEIANENIVPAVRKELQKLLVGRLKWMHLMRRDLNFKKIMNTRKELSENGDYDWLEATKLAVSQRKYLLDDLTSQYLQNAYEDSDDAME